MTEDEVLDLLSETDQGKRRISSVFLAVYFVLLPISTALAGVIGPTSIQNYVAILYLLASFSEFFLNGIRIPRDARSVLFFFAYTLLSVVWCNEITFNWYFFQFALSAIMVLSAISRSYSHKEYKLFQKSIYIGFSLVIILSIINYRSALNYRLTITIGSTMDPNDFACGLSVIIALCLSEIRRERKKLFNYSVLALALGLIIFSGSRGALMMVLVMGLVWLLKTNRSKRIKTIITILTIVIIAVLFIADNVPSFLSDRFQISDVISSGGTGRVQIWKEAINTHISANPIRKLFGFGHGGFMEAVHYIAPGRTMPYESHNMFINALIEGGIIGLLLLVYCLCRMIKYTKERNNMFGLLVVFGLIVEGFSLDVQSYRIFAVAFILAIIWKEKAMDNFNKSV